MQSDQPSVRAEQSGGEVERAGGRGMEASDRCRRRRRRRRHVAFTAYFNPKWPYRSGVATHSRSVVWTCQYLGPEAW